MTVLHQLLLLALFCCPGIVQAWQLSTCTRSAAKDSSLRQISSAFSPPLRPRSPLPIQRRLVSNRFWQSVLAANSQSVAESKASHPIDVSVEAWRRGAELVASGGHDLDIQFPDADPDVVSSVAAIMQSLSPSQNSVAEADQVDWTVSAVGNALSVSFRGPSMKPEAALEGPLAALSKMRMQRWVKRVIVGMKVCPFTQSVEWAATGLEGVGIEPGPISYPMSGNKLLLHVMVDLWEDIARMLATPPTEHSTTLLLLPKYAPDDWDRFQRASHVVVKSLTSLGVDELASVVFFHPFYARDVVEPVHEPIHGHLPPGQMLRSMLLVYYDMDEIADMDASLHQNDYSRRTPFPMINVLRSEQVQLAEQLTAGTKIYCANARRMAKSDAAELAKQLAADMVVEQ